MTPSPPLQCLQQARCCQVSTVLIVYGARSAALSFSGAFNGQTHPAVRVALAFAAPVQ